MFSRCAALTLFCAALAGPALAGGGTLVAAGSGTAGQLGDNLSTNSTTPVLVLDTGALAGKTIIHVSAGTDHTCATSSDGLAFCWGDNTNGEIGDGNSGSNVKVAAPYQIGGALAGKVVTKTVAGYRASCAMTADGLAYCWGKNNVGQLGIGSTQSNGGVTTPTEVNTTSSATAGSFVRGTVTDIRISQYHGCVVASGAAHCWGANANGQLGNNSTTSSTVAVAVNTASGTSSLFGKTVAQISAGRSNGANSGYTCVVTTDSMAHCWGDNSSGAVGDNTSTNRLVPVAVNTTSGTSSLFGKLVSQIATGSGASTGNVCAVATDGTAHCWGARTGGQIGDGGASSGSQLAPVAVSTAGVLSGKSIVTISLGSDHTCASTSDGVTYCWGGNGTGEFGNGNTTASTTPVQGATGASGGTVLLTDEYVTRLSAGADHTVFSAPAGGPGASFSSGASAVFQHMSLPCTPTASPATPASVFGSGTLTNFTTANYGVANPAANTGWVIFRRDVGATPTNVQLGVNDTLSPNTGYWIKSYETPKAGKLAVDCPKSQPNTTVTQAQGCSSSKGCIPLTVSTPSSSTNRYNLVSNPFPYPIAWSDVRIRVNGSATTYTPSQAAGLAASGNASPPVVSNTITIWNGTAYDSYSDTGASSGDMKYFKSFWVNVLPGGAGKTIEVLIPKLASTKPNQLAVTGGKASGARQAITGKPPADWNIRLLVDDYKTGWKHHSTLLGLASGAKIGFDANDLPAMPPLSAPYLYLAFPHNDWGAQKGDYATDFRPNQRGTHEWPFELRANPIGATVYLRWLGPIDALKNSQLIDVATGKAVSPADPKVISAGIPINVTSSVMQFKWRYVAK